jgi:MFS superfamily sulfate permease-like transporter
MSHAAAAASPEAAPVRGGLVRDFTASIVVFLVAMPLCMGIAIASGVPPEKGLVTGIIGGIVVGLLAGSPLQVSGPAAGLAVIVFEFVRDNGLSALGPVLLVAGLIQLVAGVARLGGVFRAISPAVVRHAGRDRRADRGRPVPYPVRCQADVQWPGQPFDDPARVLGLSPFDWRASEMALMLGLVTIVGMIGWEKLKPKALALVPGALIGVIAATVLAAVLGLPVARIAVPDRSAPRLPCRAGAFLDPLMAKPALLVSAVAIAFIASAETLLSAAAVDRMHNGVRTDYNKELRAQGVGNLLCGWSARCR